MGWYAETFDEDYLLLYGRYSESRTRGELAGIHRYCPLRPEDRLLDLGCGTGRHAVPLAAEGYRVTGVDLSQLYLDKARERAERKKVDLELLHADMRELPYSAEFDGALSLFNSFGYFDAADNRRVLARLHAALDDDGWVFLDVLDYECLVQGQHDGRTVQGMGFTLIETSRVEDGINLVHQRILKPGQPERENHIRLQLYRPADLTQLLEECGFRVEGMWGDLEGGAPAQPNSTHMYTLARKVKSALVALESP